MNSNLLFDFEVDKTANTIHVQREFAAPREKVWAAWTEQELLDQWWAPKPWIAKTKEMNFREGGYWLYAMMGPEGETHWSRADYESVQPKESFTGLDAFTDAEGNVNADQPRSRWTNHFSDKAGHTLVDITIRYDKTEDLERTLEMGFKEGFTAGLGNLDALLAKQ